MKHFPEDRILTRIRDRMLCSQFTDDSFDLSGLSPSSYSLAGSIAEQPSIGPAYVDTSGDYSAPDFNYDNISFPAGATQTPNPSLTATPSTLATTGGAALNTVAANPTVYQTGSQGTVQSIASLSSTIGQWGFGLASALSGSPSTQPQTRVVTVGSSSGNNNNLMLFGALVLAAILIVIVMED